MTFKDDEYTLSSGRAFYAHKGILGLSPSGEMFEGYDGSVFDDPFTADERREVAALMIELWKTWAGEGEKP